jgi:O-antigen/teichoic acid export membrane protein
MSLPASKESPDVTGGLPLAQAVGAEALEQNGDPNARHFATDHLQTDLKHRTVSSGFVTLTAQGAKFGLTVASTVILSRLLTPHDFGLLAMVTAIMGLLRIFKDAGLSTATIQREGITHAQVSNLFWINVAVAGLMALLMCAMAPAIAWFNHEPKLVAITLWLSITFLVSGSTVQHQALLRRQMRFKALAVIDVGSMAVSLAVGVAMAKWGCGYWSLVGMNLALEGVGLALTWMASQWRPQWPRRGSDMGSLLGFGVSMTASGALYAVTRSADSVLIGKCYGADVLGLYTRAMGLLMRPMDQLMAPFCAVLLPTLSRLQSEPERYRRVFLRLYEGMALMSFALTGLLLPLSRPVTLVLLGRQWEAVSMIFSGFALVALYFPVATPVAWLLISLGRSKDFFRWSFSYAIISISSFAIGLPFGAVGVAWAFSIGGLGIALPVLYYLAGRSGPVRTKDLWLGFCRNVPLFFVVCAATLLSCKLTRQFAPLLQLFICIPVGAAIGLGTVWAIKPQRELALDLLASVRGFLLARRTSGTK